MFCYFYSPNTSLSLEVSKSTEGGLQWHWLTLSSIGRKFVTPCHWLDFKTKQDHDNYEKCRGIMRNSRESVRK
jgi:hypothetical protein